MVESASFDRLVEEVVKILVGHVIVGSDSSSGLYFK